MSIAGIANVLSNGSPSSALCWVNGSQPPGNVCALASAAKSISTHEAAPANARFANRNMIPPRQMERHLTSGAGDAPQVLDDVFLRPTAEPPILDEAAVAAVFGDRQFRRWRELECAEVGNWNDRV